MMMMRTTTGRNRDLFGDISFLCDIPTFRYDLSNFDSQCVDQKFAMVKLAESLGMEDGVNFYENDPECKWNGIRCSGNGAVIEIRFGKF